MGDQPSWAHVVKGGVSIVPVPPVPPPMVPANPQLFRNPFKATSEILIAAKAALKDVVPRVEVAPRAPVAVSTANVGGDGKEHRYALAAPPSPALEVSIASDDSENKDASMQVNTSGVESRVSKPKKAKLSAELKEADDLMSSSPDLHHKLPASMRPRPDQESDDEDSDDSREKTNLFGLNFVMWFEVGIEGKDPMDQGEEDWGGNIEFGFTNKNFPQEMEEYFMLF